MTHPLTFTSRRATREPIKLCLTKIVFTSRFQEMYSDYILNILFKANFLLEHNVHTENPQFMFYV